MKRNHKRQLNAVLDRSHINGDHDVDDDPLLDDARIKQLANQQEASRKRFDDILSKTPDQWQSVSDPAILSDALLTILNHIRNPAGVAPNQPQPPGVINEVDSSNHVDHDMSDDVPSADLADQPPIAKDTKQSFSSRAKFIPIRLSQDERKLLRLVEAALNVSEYTDVVDVLASRAKTKLRIHTQIRDICSILTGLAVANDYTAGQRLVADRDFAQNETFFQQAFEVARRHKVANPEKMRDTYGKLMHMLQDSGQEDILSMLEFSCVKPMTTVASFLEERGGVGLLDDPLMETATREIIPDSKTRRAVQREIVEKERAVAILAKRYRNGRMLTDEDVRRCLYSIGDNNAYLRGARDPCDMMIKYLEVYFQPRATGSREGSLAISNGTGGARLTHDHGRQYRYVYQSLALWREVCHEMYKLWYLSEMDLLDAENRYVLRDTGQGVNRVQTAPRVMQAMQDMLNRVERRVGKWVGSSVVHLGDYNVPNALVFIDKYAQVQRILGPLCTCVRRLGEVAKEDGAIHQYIEETFGGVETARKMILRDFFRHAFDGSGASDWFSAGSCIDGRLTSAWNWCSEVEKRPFWPLMLLTGFSGFDGDF